VRAVSRAWKRTVAGSYRPAFRAVLTESFQTGSDPTGTELEILGGAVTLDGLADVRTTADIQIPGRHWPRAGATEAGPYGNEIFVQRGIYLTDMLIHWVGFGYLRIDETAQGDALTNGPLGLPLVDRMQLIIDSRMVSPVHFPTGTTLGTIATTLVGEVYPDAVIVWDDNSDLATIRRPLLVEEDRYGPLKSLAQSVGKIVYWNHRGELDFRAQPTGDPVFTLKTGRGGTLASLSRKVTRAGAYNGVVARGDGADQERPAYGLAYDNDPASLTYWGGRFGKVPRYYASPFLTTDGQALDAASAILVRTLGAPYNVDFSAFCDPALEPWDRGWFDHGYGGPELHTLTRLEIPLWPEGNMTGQTLEQTHLAIGTVTPE